MDHFFGPNFSTSDRRIASSSSLQGPFPSKKSSYVLLSRSGHEERSPTFLRRVEE